MEGWDSTGWLETTISLGAKGCPVKLHVLAMYGAVVLTAATPVGLRALTWKSASPAEPDAVATKAGETLFMHNWKPNDPLSHGGDGLGPVFNASSCVACHHLGGPGGGGTRESNVTTFVDTRGAQPREGVVHSGAVNPRLAETLSLVNASLPPMQPRLSDLVRLAGSTNHCITMPVAVHVSQRNTPALFGANLIDAIPEREILANERKQRLKWALASAKNEDTPIGRAFIAADGHVGRFGWKAQTSNLAEFVQAACANELGLSNPNHPQPTPLSKPDYVSSKLDLTQEQCDEITSFVLSLPRPVEKIPVDSSADQVRAGRQLFSNIGCADCHTPNLGSVDGLYSDLLLHRMGVELQGGGSYNDPPRPILPDDSDPSSTRQHPGEWRTPPLWGVADSGPYLHDGRAETLDEAIHQHRGQGARAASEFTKLNVAQQKELLAFLRSLRAP
jgi:CxxC motif-containing protein (DUF1111 family)